MNSEQGSSRLGAAELAASLEKFAASDLPNLWKPKADAFFRVESFPLLGTGKLDLRQVRETAGQLAAQAPQITGELSGRQCVQKPKA